MLTIPVCLKAADETLRRMLGCLPCLSLTQATYHPLPGAQDTRLQGSVLCRRVPERTAHSSLARKGRVFILQEGFGTSRCLTFTPDIAVPASTLRPRRKCWR